MRDFLSTKNRIHVQNPCTSGTEFWEVTFIEESAPKFHRNKVFRPPIWGANIKSVATVARCF